MLAKVFSGAVFGVDAYEIEIEVNAGHGDPKVVVVGLPVRPEGGGDSPFAARSRSFAKKLAAATGLPVELHDEAFTSVAAEGALRDAGLSRGRRSGALDAEAAAELLRDWLSSRPDGTRG